MFKIDDSTHRTTIIDNISAIFSTVNQARAVLKKKIKELASVEGVAEFNSQMKLLNQAVVNYLDICDSPEKCEEFLTKVMIQLEELEGLVRQYEANNAEVLSDAVQQAIVKINSPRDLVAHISVREFPSFAAMKVPATSDSMAELITFGMIFAMAFLTVCH